MSAAPVTSPTWTPAAERLLHTMQAGAVLHWSYRTGFVLHLPSGRATKPQLGAVWCLRRAGLIRTGDTDQTKPRTWRAIGKRGIVTLGG